MTILLLLAFGFVCLFLVCLLLALAFFVKGDVAAAFKAAVFQFFDVTLSLHVRDKRLGAEPADLAAPPRDVARGDVVELPCSLAQVAVADDVVALENGSRNEGHPRTARLR